MDFDKNALKKACYEIARDAMWDMKPIDVNRIQELANRLYEIAKSQLEFLEEGCDPNIITRAVKYLGHVHANPSRMDDIIWFEEILSALLSLAVPDIRLTKESAEFLNDIEKGIKEFRRDVY